MVNPDINRHLRDNYAHLAKKLKETTDPAQVSVLESCLAELESEIDMNQTDREHPQ